MLDIIQALTSTFFVLELLKTIYIDQINKFKEVIYTLAKQLKYLK